MSCALFVGLLVYGHRPFSLCPQGLFVYVFMPTGPVSYACGLSLLYLGPSPDFVDLMIDCIELSRSWYAILSIRQYSLTFGTPKSFYDNNYYHDNRKEKETHLCLPELVDFILIVAHGTISFWYIYSNVVDDMPCSCLTHVLSMVCSCLIHALSIIQGTSSRTRGILCHPPLTPPTLCWI